MINFDINKIPKKILDDYNISTFDNPSEAFNFLYDEEFTKEEIIAMLTEEMKDELVKQNENIRKNKRLCRKVYGNYSISYSCNGAICTYFIIMG